MLKISGYWLIVTSIIHVFVGLVVFTQPLLDIAHNGWFNVIAPDPLHPYFAREDAFWFMMMTPFLLLSAQLCCWASAKGIPLPSFPGWILLLTAVVGVILEPVSGFWLLIPPSLLMLVDSQRSKKLSENVQ